MWPGLKYNLVRLLRAFTVTAFFVTGPAMALAQSTDYSHQTVTKAEFESIGDKVIALYDKELTKLNMSVYNQGDWSAKTNDIRISHIGYPYVYLIYNGKEIRAQKINADQLALILCHEMGHLLGKGMKKNDMRITSLAAEGEADYFATMNGLKKLWADEPGITLQESGLPEIEKLALAARLEQFNIDPHSEVGMKSIRVMTAGYFVLSKLIDNKVSFAHYDDKIVKKTIKDYPSAQARLDTYIAGTLNLNRPASWSAPKRMACKSLF